MSSKFARPAEPALMVAAVVVGLACVTIMLPFCVAAILLGLPARARARWDPKGPRWF